MSLIVHSQASICGPCLGNARTSVALRSFMNGFAADKGPLEFDSRVLGDLVLPLIV